MAPRVVFQSNESQWGFGVKEAIRILNNIIFRKQNSILFFFNVELNTSSWAKTILGLWRMDINCVSVIIRLEGWGSHLIRILCVTGFFTRFLRLAGDVSFKKNF